MDIVYESTSEAAEAIGANQSTVARWIQQGHLPAERIKRAGKPSWRIRHADLIEASRGTMFEKPEPSQPMLLDSPEDQLKAALSLEVVGLASAVRSSSAWTVCWLAFRRLGP